MLDSVSLLFNAHLLALFIKGFRFNANLHAKTLEIPKLIQSFRPFLLHLFKPITPRRRSRHCTDNVPEFHAEAPPATVSGGLIQGPYMAARTGVEPMTLRTKGVDSTNAPPTPHT